MTSCEWWRCPQGTSGTLLILPHPLLGGLSRWITAPKHPELLLQKPLVLVLTLKYNKDQMCCRIKSWEGRM